MLDPLSLDVKINVAFVPTFWLILAAIRLGKLDLVETQDRLEVFLEPVLGTTITAEATVLKETIDLLLIVRSADFFERDRVEGRVGIVVE